MNKNNALQQAFIDCVWQYYRSSGRHDLPWRGDVSSYSIFISEIMLQQTQVSRVIPKYSEFLKTFPGFLVLANANLADVLQVWSGLGYNRRAMYIKRAAEQVVRDFGEQLPQDCNALQSLPGVGVNTAGSIAAFAFNQPVVFLETNIRSAYLHHFFRNNGVPVTETVSDTQLLPLVGQTLDCKQPREWYWALMDYGNYLKTIVPNPSRRSRHHARQSPFNDSYRQLRGQVIKQLLGGSQSLSQLTQVLTDQRLPEVLARLQTEGLITYHSPSYHIT